MGENMTDKQIEEILSIEDGAPENLGWFQMDVIEGADALALLLEREEFCNQGSHGERAHELVEIAITKMTEAGEALAASLLHVAIVDAENDSEDDDLEDTVLFDEVALNILDDEPEQAA